MDGEAAREARTVPPLSEAAARALVTGHLEAILTHRKDIVALNTEEIGRLAEIARATRFNCGGNNCG